MITCRMRSCLPLLAAAFLCLAGPRDGFAQDRDAVSVRGTIASFDRTALDVKSREGMTVTIKLADKVRIFGVVKASISDIKPGAYIGVSSVPKNGSASQALEIHIIAETGRGAGEGDHPWDLAPGSSMTNGTASIAVDSVDGKTITVNYRDGKRVIVVGPDTSIVAFAPADISDLRPGAGIFVRAEKDADGKLTASYITVGKDGIMPPM